jgi:hypothetical protein
MSIDCLIFFDLVVNSIALSLNVREYGSTQIPEAVKVKFSLVDLKELFGCSHKQLMKQITISVPFSL